MATLGSKRKLADFSRETLEEPIRNGQSRNTSIPRINEKYITQVSEETGGRVTEKLSREFSWTEFRILGALSNIDNFLVNPEIRTHSGTVPRTSRNTDVENQEPTEDRFQNDRNPEVESLVYQSCSSIDSDPEETSHSRDRGKLATS